MYPESCAVLLIVVPALLSAFHWRPCVLSNKNAVSESFSRSLLLGLAGAVIHNLQLVGLPSTDAVADDRGINWRMPKPRFLHPFRNPSGCLPQLPDIGRVRKRSTIGLDPFNGGTGSRPLQRYLRPSDGCRAQP